MPQAGKTYGDISESGNKSQCHTASRYHLEYSGKNGKLAVAKSLYRKADNVYECKRNVEQHIKPQKLLCKVEYLVCVPSINSFENSPPKGIITIRAIIA